MECQWLFFSPRFVWACDDSFWIFTEKKKFLGQWPIPALSNNDNRLVDTSQYVSFFNQSLMKKLSGLLLLNNTGNFRHSQIDWKSIRSDFVFERILTLLDSTHWESDQLTCNKKNKESINKYQEKKKKYTFMKSHYSLQVGDKVKRKIQQQQRVQRSSHNSCLLVKLTISASKILYL